MSELIGKTIGQYQIVEQIGVGGMATIFKAFQPSMERYVAVKILPSQFADDPNFVKRFAHEAKSIAALEHPHILPVHDFGTEGKLNYMVMRYVKGGTLSDLMGKPISPERLVQVVGNVARALDYAHSQGVVHRDIKPSNILIDKHGEVLLTDFGIAKIVESSQSTQLTAAGSILGTPAYMAPEQAQGQEVDGRTDIYSLGVVLYELLTGRPPYEAETPYAIVLKHVNDPVPPPRSVNPDIPESFERVVLKAMAKERDQRFETATQMEQALQEALKMIGSTQVAPGVLASESKTFPGTPSPATTPPAKKSLMTPLIIGGIVVALVLCLVGGGIVAILAFVSAGDDDGDVVAVTPTSVSEPDTSLETSPEVDEPLATATPQPTPTPEEEIEADVSSESDELESGILFEDEFNSDENGWYTGQDEDEFGNYEAEIVEGTYRTYLTSDSDDGNFGWVEPFELELDDFALSMDVNAVDNDGDFGYGIAFRSTPEGDAYMFEIDNDGFLILLAHADDDWEVLIDYTEAPVINPGGPNQLGVVANGPWLNFFINDEEVAELNDDSLEYGSIGLVFDVFEEDGELMVDIDNLIIHEIEEPEEGFEDELDEIDEDVEDAFLFTDFFDSDANGWVTGEFEDDYAIYVITIEDGIYTMDVTAKQPAYIEQTPPTEEFSDFVLVVEAAPHDAEEHYSYGIAFRKNEERHTYVFEIGNDGLYAIQVFDGEWQTLKDWSSSPEINVGQPNELMVMAEGDTMAFFVNGEELTVLEDDTLSAGTIGLVVDIFEEEKSATVDFDNLVIMPLE